MKILRIFILSTFLCFVLVKAKAQNTIIKRSESAIKIGSSQELSQLFNENVEIILEGKKNNYSKTQATIVMKNFFSKHSPAPKGFRNYHRGQSGNNLNYSIIRYGSETGGYRVFLKIKQYQGRYVIDSIDMTKE